MKKIILLLVIGGLGVFLLFVAQPTKASEPDDRKAKDILQKMAMTLAGAEQFSVTLLSSYDAPQSNGQMVEFGALREIQVKRPNKLRVDKLRSDGDKSVLVFDGKEIIAHSVKENVYAKTEKAGTVDDAIKYLVGVLNTPLPLARMLRTTLPGELEKMVEEIDYVELNKLTDVPTDHLAVRTRDVDFQIWITQGEKPLPKRIIITYKRFRGDPQFRAEFSNWNLGARNVIGPFAYTPPKDAEKVPMLIRKRPEYVPAGKGGAK